MSICECGQVSVPLGKVSVLVFGTIHGVTACVPSDRHWKDRAEKAEAAIALVREVCESAITDYHRQRAIKGGVARAEMASRILRALDGDA